MRQLASESSRLGGSHSQALSQTSAQSYPYLAAIVPDNRDVPPRFINVCVAFIVFITARRSTASVQSTMSQTIPNANESTSPEPRPQENAGHSELVIIMRDLRRN
jgi:hypothetical protein